MAIKELEKLTKRLGQLDLERRQIFDALRNNPQNIILMTKQMIEGLVKSKSWYEKKTEKTIVYSQLVSYEIKSKSPSMTLAKRKPIVSIDFVWNQYSDISTSASVQVKTSATISAFNEIEPQILNGFKPTVLDEKQIKKTILDLKEKNLLAQIAEIKKERKLIK